MSEIEGRRIHITGVVQGVGFRPFVYGLAQRWSLTGWVRNTSAGVDIVANGEPAALAAFAEALQTETPPLAHIDSYSMQPESPDGFTEFGIRSSQPEEGAFLPVSPDVCVCDDCLREMRDPNDRRHRYPFINCTNCGPRFTIIKDIPYDRPQTTMAPFQMCPACAREYQDPLDRRFHAQPVACAACGPQVWLTVGDGMSKQAESEQAIQATRSMLGAGLIVAVKGLGGFHLACDATNAVAVAELRRRKLRVDKPFAVMMPDLATVTRYCTVSEAEKTLLTSRERPIVLLRHRHDATLAKAVAPGQNTLGVMLPYTPLHFLLLEREAGYPEALVMTSGNLSEEPIAYTNEEARRQLTELADAFLLHDRAIHMRCDDSVMAVLHGPAEADTAGAVAEVLPTPLRRSRGYAPFPVPLAGEVPPLLGVGAELKNTFCLTHGHHAFLSHHIGDLGNYEALRAFEEGVAHYEMLFRVQPEAIAYDAHPDYLSTRYALERAAEAGIPALPVQHHHAHIAACMAEHQLPAAAPVIGVSFDGVGYGEDGHMWGGEFLVADYAGYERPYHLRYVPLPGGDRAAREPWRMALAWLHQAGIPWEPDLPPMRAATPEARRVIGQMLEAEDRARFNAPLSSSMGRLFDAAASLAGVRQVSNYEAQAAMEFEALCDPAESGSYPFQIQSGQVDPAPLVAAMVGDVRSDLSPATIAARFHNGVAQMVVEVCRKVRETTGLSDVVLSGGVWQNGTLLTLVAPALRRAGFRLYLHQKAPPNDGGLALGQVAIAARRLADGGQTERG